TRVTFDPMSVNGDEDTVDLGRASPLATGDSVIYRDFGDDDVLGLGDGVRYYVSVINDADGVPSRLRFHQNRAAALVGMDFVNLTPAMDSDLLHSLETAWLSNPVGRVDGETDTMDLRDF